MEKAGRATERSGQLPCAGDRIGSCLPWPRCRSRSCTSDRALEPARRDGRRGTRAGIHQQDPSLVAQGGLEAEQGGRPGGDRPEPATGGCQLRSQLLPVVRREGTAGRRASWPPDVTNPKSPVDGLPKLFIRIPPVDALRTLHEPLEGGGSGEESGDGLENREAAMRSEMFISPTTKFAPGAWRWSAVRIRAAAEGILRDGAQNLLIGEPGRRVEGVPVGIDETDVPAECSEHRAVPGGGIGSPPPLSPRPRRMPTAPRSAPSGLTLFMAFRYGNALTAYDLAITDVAGQTGPSGTYPFT